MNPNVNTRAKLNYNKFEQPVVSQRLPGIGIWGITETIQYVKDNVYINAQFDGQEIAGWTTASEGFRKGFRAIGNGAGDSPDWRWLHWITGYVNGFTTNAAVSSPEFRAIAYGDGITVGHPNYNNYSWDRWTVECSIAEWYKWGARKFWLHLPFGKISRNRSFARDVNGNYLKWENLVDKTIHLNAPHQEALHYQPDAYMCAKEGCTCPLTGQFGNAPMPWLTDDFVDGKTQGFVPLFKALITGTAGDLPNDVWQRLTGIGGPSAWFDPNEPIEVVVYNGSMNGETFRKWRRWCDRGNNFMLSQQILADNGLGELVSVPGAGWNGFIGGQIETDRLSAIDYARQRWIKSVEPFKRAGMRLGLDALTTAPGPVLGVNGLGVPETTFDGFPYVPPFNAPAGGSYGVTLDREWWKFFSEYIVPTFGKNNIFCEAYPITVPIRSPQQPLNSTITGWTANPYSKVGINFASGDEFFRAAFGTDSSSDKPGIVTRERGHYLEEFGNVEIVRSAQQWGLPLHVGYFDPTDGKTYANGRYWYLLPWASQQQGQFGDGSAQGSNLHPFIDASKFAQGYRYLRADGEDISAGYGYPPLVGDAVAFDLLSRYQVQKQDFENGQGSSGDPSSVLRDVTIPRTFIANTTKRKLLPFTSRTVQHPSGGNVSIPVLGRDIPGGFTFINGVTFFPTSGLTNDFNVRYPTIREFANALVPILTGTQPLDPRQINFGAPQTLIDSSKLIVDIANTASRMDRVEKIHGVMWLDIAAYDTFAGTNLRGISGGKFYIPSIEKDIPVNRLHHWLDIELLNWKRRYGFMPKYIAWNLTEYGQYGLSADGQPNGFEMERYFFLPKTIPNYNNVRDLGENFNGYRDTINNRRHLYWGSQDPGITWDASIGSERLVNRGYDIGYEKEISPGQFISVPPDIEYAAAKALTVDLLQKTKYWRDTRGLSGSTKVTVYHVPYLPVFALPVPRILGQKEAAVAITSNAGVWNDAVFPKGATVDTPQAAQSGVVAWYTPEETEQVKRSIKLEYRKRYEPLVRELEALFPEDYDRGAYDLPSDSFSSAWIETKKETLNVSNDFKIKNFWSTTNASVAGLTWSGDIHPLVYPSHVGSGNEVLSEGDPKTQKDGNLFDYSSYYNRLIDWVRDDYLRPKYVGLTATVQGMSIWDSAHYEVFNAIRTGTSTYPGITADRDRMLRWLKAEYGNGATVDWGNSADVDLKVRQYFSIVFDLNRKLLNRFRTGIPRVDVIDPYSHVPFAASWSVGYGRSTGYTLGHPSVIDGMKITDVVPMIFAGDSADRPWAALLRYEIGPGYTGNIPGGNFTNIINQYNSVPKGKRVLLPYYWHQDPVADQFTPTEYYKATADGSTYTGSLPLRSHETPGQVKFPSPWAYVQMKDAKDSVQNFLQAMYATGGKVFDYIADDAESWGLHSLGGNMNVFDGPFGPTGMPAGSTSNPGVTPGSHIEVYPTWRVMPDTRVTSTIVRDPRFTGLTVAVDGLSFSGSILKKYQSIVHNADRGIFTNTNIPPSNDTQAITAAQVLEFYIKEGPNAISACTGPAWAAQYGPPYSSLSQYVTPALGVSLAGNPWKSPFAGSQLFTLADSRISNKYMAWLAFDSTLKDFAFSNLKKPMWVDTIEGFTSSDLRGTAYSHYGINSTGITDGMFVPEANGHPRIGSSFKGIDVAPEVYGSLSGQLPTSGYYVNPTTDRQKYNLEPNTAIAGVCAFFGGNTSAYSYIATLRELASVRAMQRFNPNYWRGYCPWVTSPYILDGFNAYRADQTNVATVSQRTDPKYWEELIRQLLVSGAHHFNYFHGLLPSQTGYTGGLTGMQSLINEWKTLTDGKRVQPINPANGNPITTSNAPEMIRMHEVGGNHEGATGVMVNGCRILEKNMSSKINLPAYGGIDREERLWRITAAPQAKILRKIGVPNVFTSNIGDQYEYGSQNNTPEGYNIDLPQEVNLETGEIAYYKVRTDGRDRGGFSETWSGWQTGLPPLIPGGKISYGQTVCILSTEKANSSAPGNPNSRAELRLASNHEAQGDGSVHPLSSPLWANDSQWSEQVGTFLVKNRPTSLKGRLRVTSEGTLSPGYPFSGALGTLCMFGYYRIHNANSAFTGGAQPNDRFGLESAIMFYSDGTTGTWKIMVYRSKDPGSGILTEEITHDFDTGLPNNIERELYVWVNAERTEAKFFVDGTLVYTAKGKLPVGLEWEFSPIHCGCAVRDVSIKPSNGSQTGSPTPAVIALKNMEFTVHAGAQDKVYVTPGDRGFWIKRTGIPIAPKYSMYGQPADFSTKTIFSREDGTQGWSNIPISSNLTFGETKNTIRGINRTVNLVAEWEPGALYPQVGTMSVLRNGASLGTIQIAAQPSPFSFSANDGDVIVFRVNFAFGIFDFGITVRNVSDGNSVVQRFRVIGT